MAVSSRARPPSRPRNESRLTPSARTLRPGDTFPARPPADAYRVWPASNRVRAYTYAVHTDIIHSLPGQPVHDRPSVFPRPFLPRPSTVRRSFFAREKSISGQWEAAAAAAGGHMLTNTVVYKSTAAAAAVNCFGSPRYTHNVAHARPAIYTLARQKHRAIITIYTRTQYRNTAKEGLINY